MIGSRLDIKELLKDYKESNVRIRIPSEFKLSVFRSPVTDGECVKVTFDERTVSIHRPVMILTDIGDMFLEQIGYVVWNQSDMECSINTDGYCKTLYSKDFKKKSISTNDLDKAISVGLPITSTKHDTAMWRSRKYSPYDNIGFRTYGLCMNSKFEWFLYRYGR